MTKLGPDIDVLALGAHSKKAHPSLIGQDSQHLAAVRACLDRSIADVSHRLDAARRAPGGTGQAAMDRDQEIHRLTARLRTLRGCGPDLCLGRMIPAGSAEPVYVGRMGLTDIDGQQLLLDWRAPAAEPFFGATHADPMGLTSRRRYLWNGGQISDYWDEVFTTDGLAGHAASLDDQSAFIASLIRRFGEVSGLGDLGVGVEGDVVAEGLELAQGVFLGCIGVPVGVVVGSWVLVEGAGAQQGPDHGEQVVWTVPGLVESGESL